jgi:hypothetical protein
LIKVIEIFWRIATPVRMTPIGGGDFVSFRFSVGVQRLGDACWG